MSDRNHIAGRILVIEDEPSIADTITYILSSEGFDCHWCATCAEGMETLGKKGADLILLDVGLPDGNGFELCKTIRKSWDVPIVFLTARADEIDRVVGLEIGADDYVVKPFSPRELAARVKVILRRAGKGAPQPRPEGSGKTSPVFEVDEARCLVRFQGKALQLSRYEYRLLSVLVQRPGWVFSRDKLMNLAWDEPESSMDRTVDAHIKTLRAKLREVDSEADPIKTHRGLGYSLREHL